MADQIEALRWVKKFIKYFGGDKDCVTIVGESAGAASVGFLLLAPQTREEGRYMSITYYTFLKFVLRLQVGDNLIQCTL